MLAIIGSTKKSSNGAHHCFKLDGIQPIVVVQDAELVVKGSIRVKESLREEWEVLSIPNVLGVTSAEGNTRNKT